MKRGFWQDFRRIRLAWMALWGILFLVTVAIAGHFLTQGEKPIFNPRAIHLPDKFRPPLSRVDSWVLANDADAVPPLGRYWLGTDDLGRDVLARMLEGAKVSLSVGFVAVGISVSVGILVGAAAGYFGGLPITVFHLTTALLFSTAFFDLMSLHWLSAGLLFLAALLVCSAARRTHLSFLRRPLLTVDQGLMRLVDILLCFPSMFLILTIIAVRPPSIWNVMLVIGLTSWMGTSRLVRGEFLSLRERDFVAAGRILGLPDRRIIFGHILPNALAPIFVSTNLGIAGAILVESSLSYLGFGVPPPHATWGSILADGKTYLFDAPHLTYVPGLAIFLTVLAFNLVGEGLRDVSNRKLDAP